MAERDAAGAAPAGGEPPRKLKRIFTIADAVREMERQSAPLRAAMEKTQNFHAAITASAEAVRSVFGDVAEESSPAPPPKPAKAEQALAPQITPAPEPPSRPPFEQSPSEELLAALRQVFPGFKATDRWWVHVERELKDAHYRSNPEAHDAFCRNFSNWSAEDLVAYMEESRMIPKRAPPAKRGRRRKRAADLDVHQWIAAQLLADPEFRHLSQKEAEGRGEWSARAIGTSPVWKAMKRDLKAEIAAKAEQARAEFEGRIGEDEDNHGMRVGRKSGLGRQRPSQEDREHNAAAEDFIRAAEADREMKKKREK